MAAGAVIKDALWRNPKFRRLSRSAQCTFVEVCSQKDLGASGMLTLNVTLLASGCDAITVQDIVDDLAELETHRWVFVDYDTFELFVRSRMRSLGVVKSPNYRKSCLTQAEGVVSPKLRRELAMEFGRWGLPEGDDMALWLMGSETLPKPFGNTPSLSPPPPQSLSRGGDRPVCRRHDENHDGPCRSCEARRKWDEQHADVARVEARRAIKAARLACPHCDENGMIDTPNGVRRCTEHSEAM